MKKYTNMTEKDFNLIKTLHEAGLNAKKIHDVTGRAKGTIDRVVKCNTFEDYKISVSEYFKDYKKRKQAVDNHMNTVAPKQIDSPAVGVGEINVRLQSIEDKLDKLAQDYAWIAEHAVISEKKSRWSF